MTWPGLLPVAVLLSSLLPGLVIFTLAERRTRLRTTLNLSAAVIKLLLIAAMLWGVARREHFEFRFELLPGIDFALIADPFSLLFLVLSAQLWFLTTVYAVGYLEGSPNRSRFFGFFSLCVTATSGVAMAGNLITFILFYELLTLSTYPLVVHRGTKQAKEAGRVYLAYTVTGGAVLLLGAVWLHSVTGSLEFAARGLFTGGAEGREDTLRMIFLLLIVGVGVKAAIVPLHGWLPRAMVAPAPVSALLHAVAVVKAGAFGIIRIVYDIFGISFAARLGVMDVLAWAAAFTIVYGSVRALTQQDLKRRLAFSTVSQVSYIVLGVAVVGPLASIGGIVHLVHQGLMKITLFFCAGNFAETLGIHDVDELDGVGRRMPRTAAAFTIGALGMIGLPPMAGFVSKWYLSLGAIESGQDWVLVVLALSSALNAAYFLPLLQRIWFGQPPQTWPEERSFGAGETHPALLWPALITAAFAFATGALASLPFSPQEWADLAVTREFFDS